MAVFQSVTSTGADCAWPWEVFLFFFRGGSSSFPVRSVWATVARRRSNSAIWMRDFLTTKIVPTDQFSLFQERLRRISVSPRVLVSAVARRPLRHDHQVGSTPISGACNLLSEMDVTMLLDASFTAYQLAIDREACARGPRVPEY
jgi:hypothetical protein